METFFGGVAATTAEGLRTTLVGAEAADAVTLTTAGRGCDCTGGGGGGDQYRSTQVNTVPPPPDAAATVQEGRSVQVNTVQHGTTIVGRGCDCPEGEGRERRSLQVNIITLPYATFIHENYTELE